MRREVGSESEVDRTETEIYEYHFKANGCPTYFMNQRGTLFWEEIFLLFVHMNATTLFMIFFRCF
jgi:hypothetical protein